MHFDRWAGLDSPLHRRDPRIKALATGFAMVLLMSEPRGEITALLLYALLIAVAWQISRVPWRVALGTGLRTAPFILLPAALLTLSASVEGAPAAGVAAATSMTLRAFAGLAIAVLLVTTTRMHALLRGLRSLGMPRSLGVLFAMTYRYLFLFSSEQLRLRRAMKARTPDRLLPEGSWAGRLAVYGNLAAVLLLRAWERAQKVHTAMLARGFDGSFPEVRSQPIGGSDALLALMTIASFGVIRFFL